MEQSSLGDIIEVDVKNGFTYLQVINLHPSYPELIRHIEGVYPVRPSEFEFIAERKSKIIGMAPIANLIEDGAIVGRKVGTANIPQSYREFPTFQMPVYDAEGIVIYSWLWDGDGIWYDCNSKFAESQEYPKREVMTAKMLLERLKV